MGKKIVSCSCFQQHSSAGSAALLWQGCQALAEPTPHLPLLVAGMLLAYPLSCSPPSAFGTDLTGAHAQYWRVKAAGLAHCILFFQEGKRSSGSAGQSPWNATPSLLPGRQLACCGCVIVSRTRGRAGTVTANASVSWDQICVMR